MRKRDVLKKVEKRRFVKSRVSKAETQVFVKPIGITDESSKMKK
jgi:hypothetical protein